MIFDMLETHSGTDRPPLRSDVLPSVVSALFETQTFHWFAFRGNCVHSGTDRPPLRSD